MENNIEKCSLKSHKNYNAIIHCQNCKVFLCEKCSIFHSELFEDHKTINLDTDKIKTFSGICKEKKHNDELEYFCKDHNILCCAACISKIKDKGNGNHKDCQICSIEEIKEEKKNKLKENIIYLEELSKTLEQSIKELKDIFEKIETNKENIKLNIQKIFTKIRTTLNEREDQLLLEVDNKFNKIFFSEEFIKKCEKLPNRVKTSLEDGKLTEKEWKEVNNNKLNYFINNCINIENNLIEIKKVKENINKFNSKKIEIKFFPENENNLDICENILKFGEVECLSIGIAIGIMKSQMNEYKEKDIKYKLIYDANKDGQNYANCHSKCNNVSNTLSLVETNNLRKFGLFRSISINGQGPWRSDSKAFFISLDKEKIYRMKNGNYIAFDDDCFIQTYGFALTGNILSEKYSSKDKDNMNSYFEGFTEDYELTCGDRDFTVKKFEVFQLEII